MTRIEPAQVKAMVESSKEDLQATAPEAQAATLVKAAKVPQKVLAADAGVAGPAGIIGMDDFAKVDLRVGTVLECAFVEGSDKLLRFLLDAGSLGQRQVFSGIRAGYPQPAALVGRQVVFIANLAPRKMRFGVSEGMILSAGGDDGLFLLGADAGAVAGMSVK